MKHFKKVISLALVLAMMFTIVACGKSEVNSGVETTSDYTNMEERTIRIGTWYDIYYDSTCSAIEDDPHCIGSIADQMRFDVIKKIEEEYNVKVEYVNLTYDGSKESINTSILAGTPECDIYLVDLTMGVPAALNGLCTDLKTVVEEDADIVSENMILDYLDLGDGKACILKQVLGQNVVEATYPLGFNMQMIEENNLEDPRDLYEKGEWTWDKFIEYSQILTQDTDGDGVNDQYGFAGYANDTFENLMLSNGASIAATSEETLSTAETGEALQFVSDLYNVYGVAAPYVDDADVMRFVYRDGKVGFWPTAAWIHGESDDYDREGTKGSTLEFDTAFVQWPVGPSGDAETNAGKLTAGTYWIIPAGVEDPERVYNVFSALSNWYLGDISVRDDREAMDWWYSITSNKPEIQDENFNTMFAIGSTEQFDLWSSLGVEYDLPSLIDGSSTAAQFQETYKQEVQAALDAYFN